MTDLQSLSDREIEILELLATGKSNKEIARELHISANTVKVHVRNIFGKLEVSSRTEASMLAVRAGLIETSVAEAGPEPLGGQSAQPPPLPAESAGQPAPLAPDPAPAAALSNGPTTQTWILAGILVTLSLLIAIAFRLFNPAPSAAATQPADPVAVESQWQERPSLPEPRSHAAAVALENGIYLIGGRIGGTAAGAVARLDPDTGEWTTLAPKPTPVSEIGAAVLGGLVYVPGGRLAGGEPTAALEIYDPVQDAWRAGPDLPAAVFAYALAAFEGKLYLFGGQDGSGFSDRVWIFDPDAQTWRAGARMPAALGYAGAAAIGSRIFVIGGFDGDEPARSTLVYAPALDGAGSPWDSAAPMPEGRYGMGVVSIADKIHVIGGSGGGEGHFTQMDFAPQTDLWQVLSNPLAGEWSHAAAAALGTDIFVLGGELDGAATDRSLSYQVLFIVVIPVIP